jgi:hypothetical protein
MLLAMLVDDCNLLNTSDTQLALISVDQANIEKPEGMACNTECMQQTPLTARKRWPLHRGCATHP